MTIGTDSMDEEKRGSKEFNAFQLEEYKNISTSHFESVKQVSVFFRYYLLILAAPVFLLNIIIDKERGLSSFFNGKQPEVYYNITLVYLGLSGLVGIFIFFYVVNLRLDTILYARAVNKVRRYFYERSDLKIQEYDQYQSLPIVSTKPKYDERSFSFPLILVFALINTVFVYTGLEIRSIYSYYLGEWRLSYDFPLNNKIIFCLSLLFFFLHFFGYYYLISRRNNYYLKSFSFGVDIDGVLNNQTDHFIKWLKLLTNKEIPKNEIKEIPVHLNSGIGVDYFDEQVVFNCKEYWEQLKIKENAKHRLNQLERDFGFGVYMFSYRPWPLYGTNKEEIRNIIRSKGYTPLEKNELKIITKKWAKENGIKTFYVQNWVQHLLYRVVHFFYPQKKLTIEVGNPHISDGRFNRAFRYTILSKNRFQGASRLGFKFFIEDMPENAIKISKYCDYVFMFDEPYNLHENYSFPKNVIRVKNWDEIYHYLKTLS